MKSYFDSDPQEIKVSFTYIHVTFTLVIGMILGVVLQRYYPVGNVLKAFGVNNQTSTQSDKGSNQTTTQPDEVMDESKLRMAQAKQASQINRAEYGRVVHIYGDSIARGWGFGVFEHKNRLNRIQDIAQMLLRDNGVSEHELFFRFAWSQDVKRISQELSSGMIRDGDIIVFEDAGPHEDNVKQRRERFLTIEEAVKGSGREVSLILTTMFDYWPTPPYYNSEYDALIGDSGMTMNQVVLEIAADGYPSVLDWNKQMDQAVESLRLFGVSPMHRDAVHPNIFGNFLLATSLLNHIGIPASNYDSVKQEFKQLPPNYYTKLQWAKPLSEARLEQILQTLFEIGNSH